MLSNAILVNSYCERASSMYRFVFSALLFVLTIIGITSCSSPKKTFEEENALTALANIQQRMEADISYEQFIELLSQAKTEIDILKTNGKKNPCFVGAVEKCYASYSTASKAWKKKIEATDEKRKQDMDLTLSVMLSFAALNIQKASNCYD